MPRTNRKVKLSGKSAQLIDAFADDAKHWGWQEDQGIGWSVVNAEQSYDVSKAALETHVLKLEQTIKRLKQERKNVAAYIEAELIPRVRP